MIVAGVNAVGNDVLTVEAEQDETTGEIVISGTTDEGVVAVSCSLLDQSENEVFFGSLEVDSAAFSGNFVAPVAYYTLKCANYDGGDWVSTTIGEIEEDEEPGEEEKEEEESGSPNTGSATNEEGTSAIISGSVLFIAIVAILIVAKIASNNIANKNKAE